MQNDQESEPQRESVSPPETQKALEDAEFQKLLSSFSDRSSPEAQQAFHELKLRLPEELRNEPGIVDALWRAQRALESPEIRRLMEARDRARRTE